MLGVWNSPSPAVGNEGSWMCMIGDLGWELQDAGLETQKLLQYL